LFILAAGFGVLLRFDHQQLLHTKQLNAQLATERDRAEAETKTALNAVTFYNEVSQAIHDQKDHLKQDAQASTVYIRERVKTDDCATT